MSKKNISKKISGKEDIKTIKTIYTKITPFALSTAIKLSNCNYLFIIFNKKKVT